MFTNKRNRRAIKLVSGSRVGEFGLEGAEEESGAACRPAADYLKR